MKSYKIIISLTVAVIAPLNLYAQTDANKFAIKAHAQIGLGDAMSMETTLMDMNGKTSSDNYGVDFGWRFLQKNRHSLEANIGVGYNLLSTDMTLPKLDYNYSAPAGADMDGEPYIRHYELENMTQKTQIGMVTIPLYLSYGFRCTDWLTLHADLGVRFGIKTSSKISKVAGESFSYGVYPQYDNLMIDADYMNDFGRREIGTANALTPEVSSFTASLLAGAGLEFKLYGPLSADLSVRYEKGFTNIYKPQGVAGGIFTAENAPLTYTVADGTAVRSLTDYLNSSKLSQLSLRISLIYRF